MKHIIPINEFFSFFKRKDNLLVKVDLDEKGWVLFTQREPDVNDELQSCDSYRIDESGNRLTYGRNANDRFRFKYKIVRDGRIMKTGKLYQSNTGWCDRDTFEKIDELDRMGDIYWYDFTPYKTKLESLLSQGGFQVGLPVELVNIDDMLKDLKGGFKSLKDVYKRDYLNKSFAINQIGINVGDKVVSGDVFLKIGFGKWTSTSNVKALK